MTIKPKWDELISVIRTNGARNMILVTGSRWASALGDIVENGLIVGDANTAYSYHNYPNANEVIADDKGRPVLNYVGSSPNTWSSALNGLQLKKPIVVTEWGFDPYIEPGSLQDAAASVYRGNEADYGADFTRWMERLGLHSTAWVYSPCQVPRLLEPLEWGTCNFGPANIDGENQSPWLSTWGVFLDNYLNYANTPNLLANGDVEQGQLNWICNDGCMLNLNSRNRAENQPVITPHAFLTLQAIALQGWPAPGQSIAPTKLRSGNTYDTEVWVRQDTKPSVPFRISLEATVGGKKRYYSTAPVSVPQGEWTQVKGKITPNWTGRLSAATWYVKPDQFIPSISIDNAILR